MRIARTTLVAFAVLFFAAAQGGFAGDPVERVDGEEIEGAMPPVQSGPPDAEVAQPVEAPPLASIDIDWVVDSDSIEREPRDD